MAFSLRVPAMIHAVANAPKIALAIDGNGDRLAFA